LRVVYFGSTEFSLAGLEALVAGHYEIAAVVTRPDRPAGRGRAMSKTVVKARAEQFGIPVLQPEKLGEEEFLHAFRAIRADVGVVAAFGGLLSVALLETPRLGCLNLHASLLPRWRGAAPIQRAIMEGDGVTGVTLIVMEAGLDTGDILAQAEVTIEPEDTGTRLEEKLAVAGAALLAGKLPAWERGELARSRQDESRATYAPPLRAEERRIDWARSDSEVHNRVRALALSPGAYTIFRDRRLIVLQTSMTGLASPEQPGELQLAGEELLVCSGGHLLKLEQVKPEGKRPMSGAEFSRGYRIKRERMGE